MKIAILTTSYFPEYNGATIRTEGIAQGLYAQGNEIVIIGPGKQYSKEKIPQGIYYRIPTQHNIFTSLCEKITKIHPLRYLYFRSYVQKIIDKENIDIIHTRQPFDLFLVGLSIHNKKKIPWITEAHKLLSISDYENHQIKKMHANLLLRFERWLMNKSNGIITMTSSGKKTLQSYGVIKPIIAVPNASSIKQVHHSRHFPFKYLFYAGTAREVEGLDKLIKAFQLILTHKKDIHLVIAGGGEIKKLKNLTSDLKIENNIHFIGEINSSEIASFYEQAELFVHFRKDCTYHRDIIGLKIYDAMRLGVPIVTTNIGEAALLIKRYNIGKVSRPTYEDFSRQVISILTHKKTYKKTRNQALTIKNRCSWENVCKELTNFYKKIGEKNSVRPI